MSATVQHPRARPAALLFGGIAVVVLAAVVGELVDQVVDHDGATRLDGPIWAWFIGHRDPVETASATVISDVGSTGLVAALGLLVAIVLLLRRFRGEAILIAVVVAGSAALVEGVKTLVDRPRPPVPFRLAVETNASFPSGHALVATAVLGVLTAVAVPHLHGAPRALAPLSAVLASLAIGLSRLYLGVHWASDVVTGWLLGALWLAVCLTAARLLARRSHRSGAGDASTVRTFRPPPGSTAP